MIRVNAATDWMLDLLGNARCLRIGEVDLRSRLEPLLSLESSAESLSARANMTSQIAV